MTKHNCRALVVASVAVMAFVELWVSPPIALAARAIQGMVGEVTVDDGAALGPVGFRVYSALPGGQTWINQNVSSCRNVRCIRSFLTNATLAAPGAPGGGGYVGNSEATQVYNSDIADQPFYELVDADMNGNAGNHILYYGVSGTTANNVGLGSPVAHGCPGATATNCFMRIDSSNAEPPLQNASVTYGGAPGSIRAVSGLNPVPNVRVRSVAGSSTLIALSWNDPPTYVMNMRASNSAPAPPTPVKGVRLWKLDIPNPPAGQGCTAPLSTDPGWTPIGAFDLGQTTTLDTLPSDINCRFYALTVRLIGPGGGSNELETYRVGVNSQAVAAIETPVRIVSFQTAYAGHRLVSVVWQSGVEGGVRGYYVMRASAPDGPFLRVAEFVPAEGDGSRYAVLDSVPAGARQSYYYRIDIAGSGGDVTRSSTSAVTAPERRMKVSPSLR
jgi:hypothetical protein